MTDVSSPDAAYDVTLHPFDEAEYTGLLIPVVLGLRPVEDLTARYGIDPEATRLIHAWVPRMRDALTSLRAGEGVPWSMVVNFAAAALSANLRPVYHLGDLGLSYWHSAGDCPFRTHTRSMAILGAQVPALGIAVSEIREGFVGPCSAGSYISSGDVVTLIREMEQRPWQFVERLRAAKYDAESVFCVVLEVLHFARERRLGLIEVTHAVSPDRTRALFPREHLRAPWARNLSPTVARRVRELFEAQKL